MACCAPNPDEPLYVILPYFNFCGFKRRRELFIKFVESMRTVKNIRVIVSEVQGRASLDRLPPVWKHIKFNTKSRLWLKENLINLAVRSLPPSWKYVAWIDADIDFLNSNWVQDTIDALGSADVVQMWRNAINLGPNGEVIKMDKSFAYMFKGSGTPWTKSDVYGFWHPGYAWACTRRAWDTFGGLMEWAILGSGDRHFAMAFAGLAGQSAPGTVHPVYRALLDEFQLNIKMLKLLWVDGTIVHHWHGSLENRKYRERWDILTKNQYNPLEDMGVLPSGLLQMSDAGQRFQKEIDKYFLERAEDL